MSGDLDTTGQVVEVAAGEIQERSGLLLADAEALLRDVGQVLNRNYHAMELWRRWFREFGEPWFKAEDGELWCVFCDGTSERHKRGCIYMAAERLVNG